MEWAKIEETFVTKYYRYMLLNSFGTYTILEENLQTSQVRTYNQSSYDNLILFEKLKQDKYYCEDTFQKTFFETLEEAKEYQEYQEKFGSCKIQQYKSKYDLEED